MKIKFTARKSFMAAGIFVALGIASAGCGDSAATSATGETKEANAAASTEKPAEKKWSEVLAFKGSGMKKSASFHLSGGKAKVKYTYKADVGLFSFYVVPEGEDVMKDGGIPEVMTQQSESSETYITKDEGNYYLYVNSANGNWDVSVEEEQ
jgi:hypothetical protein